MTIENIMYLILGFLLASFLAIIAMPSIWKRAVRLTKKRIEAATPITMSEFRADKDQLRAEFALTQRRLERNIEGLRGRLTQQLTELNTAKTEMAVAQGERDRLVAVRDELEARNEYNAERLRDLEREVTDLSQKLRTRERELQEAQLNRLSDQAAPTPASDPVVSIREALNRNTSDISKRAENINDAYNRISQAGSHLSALLDENTKANEHKSLAETLTQEDMLEKLHKDVSSVETQIAANWATGKIKKSDLRNKLGEIATTTSQIVYATEGDKAEEQEQSLFDRIRKFAGEGLNEQEISLQEQKQRESQKTRNLSGNTLSDRIAAYQNLHANN